MPQVISNCYCIVMRQPDPDNTSNYYLSYANIFRFDDRGYILDERGGQMQTWGWFNCLKDLKLNSELALQNYQISSDRKLMHNNSYVGIKVATTIPRSILRFFYALVAPRNNIYLIPLIADDSEERSCHSVRMPYN